jgi:outer membrane lipoprotein SlyB
MRVKMSIIFVLMFAFLLGIFTPLSASAVVHRRYTHTYVRHRSKKKQAAIIGGTALGGAAVGALAGGKKGALIGAGVGAAGGAIYNQKTKNKVVVQ